MDSENCRVKVGNSMDKSRTSSRRKTRKKALQQSSVKLPPKRVRERFLIIYELEGCQKAANYLTKYYGVRKIRIFLKGRKVGKSSIAYYLEKSAYFKKEGLNRKTILHELYHHLIEACNFEMPLRKEEKEANSYARCFLKKQEKQSMFSACVS